MKDTTRLKLFSELKFTVFFFEKKEPSQIYFDLQKDFFRYFYYNLKSIVIIRYFNVVKSES
jgi:hypothetical protein